MKKRLILLISTVLILVLFIAILYDSSINLLKLAQYLTYGTDIRLLR